MFLSRLSNLNSTVADALKFKSDFKNLARICVVFLTLNMDCRSSETSVHMALCYFQWVLEVDYREKLIKTTDVDIFFNKYKVRKFVFEKDSTILTSFKLFC